MINYYKRGIEHDLYRIAFARFAVRLDGGDVTEIDEFIATRGAEIFEEVSNMNPVEVMIKMIEEDAKLKELCQEMKGL